MPPDGTAGDSTQKKGYQEYAIQQAAYEVPLKSNRYKFLFKQGCFRLLAVAQKSVIRRLQRLGVQILKMHQWK